MFLVIYKKINKIANQSFFNETQPICTDTLCSLLFYINAF